MVSALSRYQPDLLIGSVLAMAAAVASHQGARLVDPVLFDWDAWDVWYQSDIPRVVRNMSNRWSDHGRTSLHPLFSLIAFPPVFVLTHVFPCDAMTAIRIVIAGIAALWIGALFIVLRLICGRRLDSVLFTLAGATSASAVFWFTVPETFSFGSLTILTAMVIAASAQHRVVSAGWYLVASALALSITVTNWMAGLLATIVHFP